MPWAGKYWPAAFRRDTERFRFDLRQHKELIVACCQLSWDLKSSENAGVSTNDIYSIAVTSCTLMGDKISNKVTAAMARALLCKKDPCFRILTGGQKTKIAVAFAKKGVVVYGQAFDLVNCDVTANLDDEADIARVLPMLRLYEVKSSSRTLRPGFADYFFSFSTAELLVAQSLGANFRFAFVNVYSEEILDLSLQEVFARARAIYPSWSVKF